MCISCGNHRLTYTALYISTGISCYRAPFSCYLTTFFKSDEFKDYREPLTELFYALLR